ncbi:melanopsin [Biomphalaria glabrata]|nr:melanopsin-like [Biomphalaria glabrata]
MDNLSSICISDLSVSSRTCSAALSTSGQPELTSYFQSLIIDTVNRVAINTVLGMTGVASNVINMCVFLKQGLHVSMNINYFVLANVDLLRTINYLWMTVCLNPEIETLDAPFIFQDIQYLTNGWISGSLERVTIFIIAFMTVQRCFSILRPLTIKRMITPVRSAIVLLVIFLINGVVVIPGCISIYFDYRFYQSKNRTLPGLAFLRSNSENEGIAFVMQAVLYVISLSVLIIFTLLLVLQMKQQSKWRLTTLIKNQHPVISKRDKKTSMLVSLLAIFLLVLCTPKVVVSIASTFVPDFSVSGKQVNLFSAVLSFAHVFGAINVNLNIFIYYTMSSKYRLVLKSMFTFFCDKQNTPWIESYT